MFTFPVAHFGGGLDFTIDQAVRFNDDDSAFLKDAAYSSSPTSSTDCTLSFWVKRCNLSTTQCLFFGGDGAGSTWEVIRFESDDQFRVGQASSAYDIITTQVFRDVGAWSNFVIAFNGDDSTAADRIKIYHNGSRITDFSLQTNPSSGYVTNFNSGGGSEERLIGFQGPSSGGSNAADCYLAEINFIDGQALDPTSFGETNSDTGQWVPINTSGLTFGTNGYRITGADSSDLGADQAGSNDFTSSGLAAADQVTDTPTNNTATWNAISGTVNPATLSDGNLTALRSGNGSGIERSTISFPATENFYAEFTIDATGSGSHVWEVGVIADDDPGLYQTSESRVGNEENGYSYRTNWSGSPAPSKVNNGTATSYGSAGSAGHVIGVQLNGGSLTFYHNNSSQGVAFTGLSGNFLFAFSGQGGAKVTANFGQTGFTYTPPTGAKALSTANLADPSIPDPSLYFQSTLYTGNGSTQSINQNGNSTFQPDWAWIKARGQAYDHALYDAVRGATKELKSNATDAESTITNGLTAFESDGFALGDRLGVNQSGENFVAWQWNAGGTSTTNSDGSVSATVMASPTAGFSICKFNPGGNVNMTFGHGLGVAPRLVIVKNLEDGATNWQVLNLDVGVGNKIFLNSTAAASSDANMWQNTAPTSTVVSMGTAQTTNEDVIALCFAEVPGFSSIGSYSGNSSSDGPFVFTGFKPAWLLIKRASSGTGNWDIFDNQRDPINPADAVLDADANSAEATFSTIKIDLLSNGFKARGTQSNINASGSTYIYMAFSETPFKTATAR